MPITWKYDDYIKRAYAEGIDIHTIKYRKSAKELLTDFCPKITHKNDEHLFRSSIELRNIDFTFVGYYYCVKNASKDYEFSYLEQTKQASRIYLFVNGKCKDQSRFAQSTFFV